MFSKMDLIKREIPFKLLKLHELQKCTSLLLTYQQENSLKKDPEKPSQNRSRCSGTIFLSRILYWHNSTHLDGKENNLICDYGKTKP